MAPNTETQPLLNAAGATKHLTFGCAAAYALAVCRPAVGAVFAVAPAVLRKTFIPGEQYETTSIFLPRLVGIREIVIGGLLWKALRESNDGNRKEVHRLILANLAVDVLDALSAGAALAQGKSAERAAAGWFGAGALFFVLLGLVGLQEC
jgi:hypothetical protein